MSHVFLLTCFFDPVYVSQYNYYPIKSLISFFNCWFDSKYSNILLFIFFIFICFISLIYFYQLTIIKKSQKTKLIPWAGSHEYYVNQNGRRVHVMDAHSIIRNHCHCACKVVYLCKLAVT